MQALLDVILPVFLLIGVGYVAVWRGGFQESWIEGLLRFTQNYAIPCMLFRGVAQLDLGADVEPLMLVSFYSGALTGFAAGLLGARSIFKRNWDEAVAIGFVGLFSNSVMMGLPISERAWGAEALGSNYAIIAFHAAFCYGVGITAMEAVRSAGRGALSGLKRVAVTMAKNPLVIAVLLGTLANLTDASLPQIIDDVTAMMAKAVLPGALFGLGGTLYFYRPEGDIRVILYIVAISLLLHPAITWSMGRAFAASDQAFRSSVITAAMAPGINAYIFASTYGVAKRVAASAVLIGTACTLLTAWFWLSILP